jgi:sulfur relay (sulfurtransferase) complex TusBCD TusD component (DsrE family)
MDARGIKDTEIMEASRRSTLDELTEKTASADKVLVF